MKKAFTLAEVIVTIGIIGIVAAMTLPAVINKYQAVVLRTKFLQANTILQDGVTRMRGDEVDLNEVINGTDTETIKQYFSNGNCTLPDKPARQIYVNIFGKPITASASTVKFPYCLKNGMTLWFAPINKWNNGSWIPDGNALIAIDINGWQQRPNAYGKDMFFWYYSKNNKTIKPTGKHLFDLDSPTNIYYKVCPGNAETMSESGIGCTSEAISDPFYFNKLKLSH